MEGTKIEARIGDSKSVLANVSSDQYCVHKDIVKVVAIVAGTYFVVRKIQAYKNIRKLKKIAK